ncbi:hypothetical protein CAEBREN_06793 [Caenorhabditis brenneri]|uniref:Uncharacterized protein n=1 Tax=Caenorhabditis brenneri TaxID=135651 RepID=G0P2S5_CAEBE|nr:hypothetical protein CAEBREN_06793 [Caenorhabditis brenneri]
MVTQMGQSLLTDIQIHNMTEEFTWIQWYFDQTLEECLDTPSSTPQILLILLTTLLVQERDSLNSDAVEIIIPKKISGHSFLLLQVLPLVE